MESIPDPHRPVIDYAHPPPTRAQPVLATIKAPYGLSLLLIVAGAIYLNAKTGTNAAILTVIVAALFIALKLRRYADDPWVWRVQSALAIALLMFGMPRVIDVVGVFQWYEDWNWRIVPDRAGNSLKLLYAGAGWLIIAELGGWHARRRLHRELQAKYSSQVGSAPP